MPNLIHTLLYGWRLTLRLPNTAHTSRPWRIHELPFRTGSSTARCERLTRIGMLPGTALAAGSYLKTRVTGRKMTFVTPPADSMGP
jgi:hypothetical protein